LTIDIHFSYHHVLLILSLSKRIKFSTNRGIFGTSFEEEEEEEKLPLY